MPQCIVSNEAILIDNTMYGFIEWHKISKIFIRFFFCVSLNEAICIYQCIENQVLVDLYFNALCLNCHYWQT